MDVQDAAGTRAGGPGLGAHGAANTARAVVAVPSPREGTWGKGGLSAYTFPPPPWYYYKF